MTRLAGKKIAILVAGGVEDLEFSVPMMRLHEEGAEVLAAGLDLKPVHSIPAFCRELVAALDDSSE